MQTRRLTALTGILTLGLAIFLPDSALAAKARLWYVVDGDSIRLRSEKYVRLIGVDAPESSECGGAQAPSTQTASRGPCAIGPASRLRQHRPRRTIAEKRPGLCQRCEPGCNLARMVAALRGLSPPAVASRLDTA
jgi:hypothetical protein